MQSRAQWGLGSRKQLTNPPKCFNLSSRPGIEQPLTCRVHPVAIVKILDAFGRRPEGATRTIGTLLGSITEGSIVDITDCFPVVHKDTDDAGVLMDQDYHKQMLNLRLKVSPRETVVGWFSTGDEIIASSAFIHAFYCTKASMFTPTALLPGPMLLMVDTSCTQQQTLGVKAYVNIRTAVADSLFQFREVPLQVQTSLAEKSGISQLMQARRMTREAIAADKKPKDISGIDGFVLGLKELLALFRRIQEYTKAVQAGKMEGDLAVGRGLTAQLCAEPLIDASAVEQLCQGSLQDALMVVYLSNLTKTQISIAEKIQALYSNPEDNELPFGGHRFGGKGGAGGGGQTGMICRAWQNGTCTWGERCRFVHN